MQDRPLCDPNLDEINPDLVAAYERLRENIVPSTRIDGWTGARQKRFLEFIADGATVADACRLVHMSIPSAYAFRRRARGQAFHLGWQAADLLARERIAADLLARAVDGQEVVLTRADGVTFTRHRYDNGLALRMLDRLDRYADKSERTAPGHAARLVAAEFDAYLHLVEGEGGPARAGLFMLARDGGSEGTADDLQPVKALARADRFIRCGSATGDEVAVADLDPARRADWTAEQWARAEAAGVVALAPAPKENASGPIQPSTCSSSPEPGAGDEADQPVWWSEHGMTWRTRFPPTIGFYGRQYGEPGDEGYERDLDDDEAALIEAPYLAARAERLARGEEERDRYFATIALENEEAAQAVAPAPEPDRAPACPHSEIIGPAPCIPNDSRALADGEQPIRSDIMADTGNDITILNSLVKTLNDSIQGYQESAKDIGNQRYQSMFQDRAMERQKVVTKLQAEVGRLGGDPSDGGSLLGSAHHIFLNMKSAITGKDDQAILAEVQRGEEYLREKFDTALADSDLSSSARQVVEQAAQSVRQGADSIRQHSAAM